MSEAAVSAAPVATTPPSKRRRIVKIVSWVVGLVVLLVLLHLAGVDVWGWLTSLWDTVKEISFFYIVVGCIFQGAQTMLTALGWYGILRYAYPGGVTYMTVLASYAAGVALNNFLPANIGTFVTLVMYVAVVRGSTFPGILAGYVVQKIFYFVIGTLIYLYLFTQIAGSFDFRFGDERDAIFNHPVLTLVIIGGGLFLIVLLLRIFWRWVKGMTRTITAPDAPLTDRQREVVALIAAGCSNDEVGQSLGISSRTAKAHSDVLRVKLGVTRRRQIPAAYRLLTGEDPYVPALVRLRPRRSR